MIRSSITGTSAMPVARCSSASARVASGSNLRRSTIVQAMVAAMTICPKPHAWKVGAATTTVSSPCHGIRSSIAASSSGPPPLRVAPLGVPVVPEVRSTTRPGRL